MGTCTRTYFGCANFSTTYRRGAQSYIRVSVCLLICIGQPPGFFSPAFFRNEKHVKRKIQRLCVLCHSLLAFLFSFAFVLFVFFSIRIRFLSFFSPFKISHKTSACGCWHFSQRYYHSCCVGFGTRTPGQCVAFSER